MGIAYSTISLVVLENAPPGQEGATTSAMNLGNTVGIALGTGIGGILIAALSTGETASRTSLAVQDLLMIGVLALAILAAARLPDRPPVRAGKMPADEVAPEALTPVAQRQPVRA